MKSWLYFWKSYPKNILNVQINQVYYKRNNKSKRKILCNYFTAEESPLVTIILMPDGPIPLIHQCKSSCILSTNKLTQIYYNKAEVFLYISGRKLRSLANRFFNIENDLSTDAEVGWHFCSSPYSVGDTSGLERFIISESSLLAILEST